MGLKTTMSQLRKLYTESFWQIKDLGVNKYIKLTRLRWVEHSMRKDETDIYKKISVIQPEGKREPRMRWMDDVDEYVLLGGTRELWFWIVKVGGNVSRRGRTEALEASMGKLLNKRKIFTRKI
ncbi:hypothetical protein C0J52_02204 [Blattella germanica]|nr:hypothetical protein C0J52_02204 [Blattella germanica]